VNAGEAPGSSALTLSLIAYADQPLAVRGERVEYRVVFADGLSAANLDT